MMDARAQLDRAVADHLANPSKETREKLDAARVAYNTREEDT
jgi:hypothetical protein